MDRPFTFESAYVATPALRGDGFLRVADYIFDGIFADWAVLDRIHQSQAQVQDTRAQICRVLEHLRSLMAEAAAEQAELRSKMEQLVTGVPM